LWPTQIDWLFLTHHHFDHNADLPCFLLCRWDQSTGKENRLQVFGPPPTAKIVDALIGPDGAFADDWKARVNDPTSQHVHVNRGGSLPRPQPALDVFEIQGGETIERGRWKTTSTLAHHMAPFLRSLAYRVDTERGSIVFASDTGPCKAISDLAQGADVIVANCWNHQDLMESSGEALGQTGTLDAARFARESGASMLILAHTGPSLCLPGSKEKAIGDISAAYGGKIVFGQEGMVLDLWPRS